MCFLDCKLPINKAQSYHYSPQQEDEPGIALIPKISELNENLQIIIFSAYISKSEMEAKALQYSQKSNIIDFLSKKDSGEYHQALKKALKKLNISISQIGKQRKKSLSKVTFDYQELDSQTQLLVRERTKEIKKLIRRTGQDIFDIGKYLSEVKQSLPHGQFYPWLKMEFQWSFTTAARFMRVYEKFKSVTLTDLNLAPTVLYELSYNVVPDEAVNETIELAKSGQIITNELVKEIRKKHQTKSPTKKNIDSQLGSSQQPSLLGKSNNLIDSTAQIRQDLTQPKQKILQVISREKFWQLEQHSIICAEPNSSQFIQLLPQKVALSLSFPPEKHWQFEFKGYNSTLNFHTSYQDLDFKLLFESIDRIINLTTNSHDNIAICFIPHPLILELVHNLGCRAFIAEPDYDKCQALIAAASQKLKKS